MYVSCSIGQLMHARISRTHLSLQYIIHLVQGDQLTHAHTLFVSNVAYTRPSSIYLLRTKLSKRVSSKSRVKTARVGLQYDAMLHEAFHRRRYSIVMPYALGYQIDSVSA